MEILVLMGLLVHGASVLTEILVLTELLVLTERHALTELLVLTWKNIFLTLQRL